MGRTLSRYIIPSYNFPYKPDSLKKDISLVLPSLLLNLAVAVTSLKYGVEFDNQFRYIRINSVFIFISSLLSVSLVHGSSSKTGNEARP